MTKTIKPKHKDKEGQRQPQRQAQRQRQNDMSTDRRGNNHLLLADEPVRIDVQSLEF